VKPISPIFILYKGCTIMKKPSYSHSALEMFHGGDVHGGCPWAYKLIRIDKIPRATSEPLITGQMLHELAAKYLTRLIDVSIPTDWDYAQSITPKEAPADVLEVWPRFVENLILPPMDSPGVEKQIAFNREWEPCGYWDNDVYFRMVLDLTFLQGGLAVVKDWKSNRSVIRQIEKNLQLRTYGWGALRALYPGAEEILLKLYFMRYGYEPEPVLLTPDDLNSVPDELEAKIAEIEAEKHFDPRPGSYCSWCGVQTHCPVMEKALVDTEVVYPVTQEDAVKAATLLLAIRQMDSIITAHLKNWSRQMGSVRAGDQVYGPIPGVDYYFDPKGLTEQLLGMGFSKDDVWKVLSVGKTSLEEGLKKMGLIGKRAKERKALMEQLLASAESKPTEQFKFYKAK
jgi:hypothetical protein